MSLIDTRRIIDSVKNGPIAGIPTVNPKLFNVRASNKKNKIYIEGPDDTVIDDQEICRAKGILILRREDTYPLSERDETAVEVLDLPREKFETYKDNPYEDTNVTNGTTYYYTAFTYSDHGVYNRSAEYRGVATPSDKAKVIVVLTASEAVGCKITAKKDAKSVTATVNSDLTASLELDTTGVWDVGGQKVTINDMGQEEYIYPYYYGFDLTSAEPDPDARVTYPSGLDNSNFIPAYMDFESDQFNYGGWEMKPGEKFMPKPVMLSYTGEVMEELNPNDYTKKIDGNDSSVANANFSGNAMMEWGKIFTCRTEEDGIYKFRCSDMCLGDDWDCWCNYDQNDNQIDHFYTSIYNGANISGKIRSISGVGVEKEHNFSTQYNLAIASGEGWGPDFIADRLLIQDLLVLMAKNTNSKVKYGTGRAHRSVIYNQLSSGTMNDKGMFYGKNDMITGVKVFGIENFWGNTWRRIGSLYIIDRKFKIKITPGTHDGSEVTDYNTTGEGYILLDRYSFSETQGLISKMCVTKWGRLPIEAKGSNGTFESDLCAVSGGTYVSVASSPSGSSDVDPGMFAIACQQDRIWNNVGISISFKQRR